MEKTQNVIEWFMNIEEKSKYTFIVFDIKHFYPSIKETRLIKAINFVEKLVNITNEDKVVIKHARKSLLYDNSEPWMKKDSGLFNVTMGAYDGAEVWELVGTFLLYKLSLKYNKNDIGLYRDDGLAIFKNISGPKSEKVKKDIQKLFKENELDIVIQCNMKTVNYFDITLNLENPTYRPHQKENNQIKYINIESNHPPSIIKQLQLSIKSRLSSLFSSEETFNDSVKIVYSCTRNIKTMINSHNAKILFPEKCTEQRTSNFSNKVNCPLEQKYLTRNIVCKAKVTSRNQNYQQKVYFGSCETTFKKRFSNHKK